MNNAASNGMSLQKNMDLQTAIQGCPRFGQLLPKRALTEFCSQLPFSRTYSYEAVQVSAG